MPCVSLPHIDPPGLELLEILLPTLDIPIPSPGADLCCTLTTGPFRIPGTPFALGTLPLPGLAALVTAAMVLIKTTTDQLNDILDQVNVSCPIDDLSQ